MSGLMKFVMHLFSVVIPVYHKDMDSKRRGDTETFNL
jgi:hypothetical protein